MEPQSGPPTVGLGIGSFAANSQTDPSTYLDNIHGAITAFKHAGSPTEQLPVMKQILQANYNRLNQQNYFEQSGQQQQFGHELRGNWGVQDPTQGGLVASPHSAAGPLGTRIGKAADTNPGGTNGFCEHFANQLRIGAVGNIFSQFHGGSALATLRSFKAHGLVVPYTPGMPVKPGDQIYSYTLGSGGKYGHVQTFDSSLDRIDESGQKNRFGLGNFQYLFDPDRAWSILHSQHTSPQHVLQPRVSTPGISVPRLYGNPSGPPLTGEGRWQIRNGINPYR